MNKKKVFSGTVVSLATKKTVIVALTRVRRHPLYKKAIKRTRRFAAHNESLTLTVGDKVEIMETRPVSRTKHFIVTKKAS